MGQPLAVNALVDHATGVDLAFGPYLAAAALLVLAGLPKLRDPSSLVRALRSVLPARTPSRGLAGGFGRALALGEVVLGTWALVAPSRLTGGLLALAYAAFSGFVALALRRGGVLASCGCFGRTDTPPTRTHLVVTALLALSGLLVALAPPGSAWSRIADHPATGAAAVGFAALVGVLAYLAIAVLPSVTPAAVRSATAPKRG